MTPALPGDGASTADAAASALSSTGRYDSFVLRVFSRARDHQMLHGEVTHVSSRRTQRFTDLDSAVAFIVAQLGSKVPGPEAAEHD